MKIVNILIISEEHTVASGLHQNFNERLNKNVISKKKYFQKNMNYGIGL